MDTEPIVEDFQTDAPPPIEELPETELPQVELPQAEIVEPLEAIPIAATQDAIQDLVKLCKIAKRPELLASWIERNFSVSQAQESLLKEMEAQDVEIFSARPVAEPNSNPLLQAAKKRSQF